MAKKSIGQFIAALRKANGMTQKQLAEKLNVSDKAVSRWERDECAPDLSLIPVIAEVFGISCDELLCGERKTVGENNASDAEDGLSPRGEKQRRRILAAGLSEYKSRSMIACGASVAGLIAALICNFGFNRAYIGFFAGAVFYLAAVICQAVFMNKAFFFVYDDSLCKEEAGQFKRSVIQIAEYSVGLTVLLAACSLPLIVYPWDTYMGLTGATWLAYGAAYGVVALVLWWIARYFINAALVTKEVWQISDRDRKYRSNCKRKLFCIVVLAAALLLTCAVDSLLTHGNDAAALATGTVFEDYESFAAFMEQDMPDTGEYGESIEIVEIGGEIFCDEYSNDTEEEVPYETLEDAEGNILCKYTMRNRSVVYIRYAGQDDGYLPIEVVTRRDLPSGERKLGVINTVFVCLGAAEIAITLWIYFRKREK